MTDIDHIIFDCDGVLIDSEVLSMQVWIDLLAQRDIRIDANYFALHFLGRSFEHVKARIKQDFGFSITAVIADEFASKLREAFSTKLKITPGLLDILPRLKVPYSLATSSSPERTAMALNIAGLTKYFSPSQIFTASMVERGKPAPDLFLHVANVYNIAPQRCLVIEDSTPGLQAAISAGMQWRHYTGGSHLRTVADLQRDTIVNWQDFALQFEHLLQNRKH